MGGNTNCSVGGNPHTDMNLAPVIRPDGSLVAWTRWDIWRAKNWKDPASYKDTGQAPDFNMQPPTPWEGEDPSMWVDCDGRFHIVSHNGDRGQVRSSAAPSPPPSLVLHCAGAMGHAVHRGSLLRTLCLVFPLTCRGGLPASAGGEC